MLSMEKEVTEIVEEKTDKAKEEKDNLAKQIDTFSDDEGR